MTKLDVLIRWVSRVSSIPAGTRGRPAAVSRCVAGLRRYGVAEHQLGTAAKPELPPVRWMAGMALRSDPRTQTALEYLESERVRVRVGRRRAAVELAARLTSLPKDEHVGYDRGDYHSVSGLDFATPSEARRFLATPGTCLALVNVTRTRRYAKSYGHGPSTASQAYLVGQNEAGTGFAHAVPKTCSSIDDAVRWIWGCAPEALVARQGDVALVWGRGPKMPYLPSRHEVDADARIIRHPTHPDLPLPGPGQRVIVGRRASDRYVREGHGD